MSAVLLLLSIEATYSMIDPVTGLPYITSDVYQIPLNTDSLPYKDLQAEARLPRQPLLPDDIIPTVALLTGLRSDNTGEVVHTDDNHAAKVYVVNQPVSSSASGGNSSGLDFSTLTSVQRGTNLTSRGNYNGVAPLGTTAQKLYRLIVNWYIDISGGAPFGDKGDVEWKLGSQTVNDPLTHVVCQPIAYMTGPPDIVSQPFHYVYDFPGGLPLSNTVSSPGDTVWILAASSVVTTFVGVFAWYGD